MSKKAILYTISILFMLLFLYAGIVKFLDFRSFTSQLMQSPLLKPMARWLTWAIPGVEMSAALLLANTRWRLKGLYTSFALMLVFTIYLILLTYFIDYISCDCGGFLENIPPQLHIVLNILLSGAALTGILLEKQIKKSKQKELRPTVHA